MRSRIRRVTARPLNQAYADPAAPVQASPQVTFLARSTGKTLVG